jgi:16S rRNA (guanine(1405)-N(7))-methyltransferase
MLSETKTTQLLNSIRENKKYSSISEDLIRHEISSYFKINPKKVEIIERPRSEKFKKIVKDIRAKLHLAYGSFQSEDKDQREDYLKSLQGINDYKTFDKILSTSVSSKERLDDYEFLYKEIFKITGKPKKILDLGCGLNPISFPYMGINSCVYYAYDIDETDIGFLNEYFSLMKQYSQLNGKAFVLNIKNKGLKLPKGDICFMFKLLDVIEKNNHKLSEYIIKTLDCNYIVASFSIKTVSGKKMNHPYRGWIEKMLERIDFKFEKILTENEVFYIIKTKSF